MLSQLCKTLVLLEAGGLLVVTTIVPMACVPHAALPVVALGFLQLLVLPGVPLLQLHLGLLLPLGLLRARVAVCGGTPAR